jgi:acyl-CoA reductase-like NAD-dependent aldehyde dehydrogenase
MPEQTGPRRLGVRKTYKLYVNGEFVRSESGRAYTPAGAINIPRGSRKDLRDAVRAARSAFPGWAGRTALNRGQVLYRAAEMLDGRGAEFVELLGGGAGARRELEQSIEVLVWYAGWTDKLQQVLGTVNPVAGPYFNFTLPEPTGVVAIVAPEEPRLLGLVRRMAAALCGGNVVVALASESNPRAALTLAEVLATSDFPAGVVNVLSGLRRELLPWLAIEALAANNVKRVVKNPSDELSPYLIAAFLEMKTVWHPIGV